MSTLGKQPTCKYCNMTLKWPKWTGKPQRPVEPNGQQHDCPEFGNGDSGDDNKQKFIRLFKKDMIHCELCNNWLYTDEVHEKYPQVNYTSVEDHLKRIHPNGEILDDIDFMCVNDDVKEKHRKLRQQPKPTKLYTRD